jgi:tRNA G18 (ribose-2'-O)-methylase SpoU
MESLENHNPLLIRIQSLDDPRIQSYRSLRDRTLRGESLFIAEGRLLVARLLASRFETESVFVAEEFFDEFFPRIPPQVPVFVAPEKLLLAIVGFPFHRGILAVGRRPEPERGTGTVFAKHPEGLSSKRCLSPFPAPAPNRLRLVVCPEITKPENMGLIFRSAAGFAADGVVLGERCCDPLSRRCLRLSMGAVLDVPFVKTKNLAAELPAMKQSLGLELFATVLDPTAEPLPAVRWPDRSAVLFGNEMDGLAPEWLALCDRRVTIPMAPGVDSLNLGVAAGIFLYTMQG